MSDLVDRYLERLEADARASERKSQTLRARANEARKVVDALHCVHAEWMHSTARNVSEVSK